jgi:hypothetical protein
MTESSTGSRLSSGASAHSQLESAAANSSNTGSDSEWDLTCSLLAQQENKRDLTSLKTDLLKRDLEDNLKRVHQENQMEEIQRKAEQSLMERRVEELEKKTDQQALLLQLGLFRHRVHH